MEYSTADLHVLFVSKKIPNSAILILGIDQSYDSIKIRLG